MMSLDYGIRIDSFYGHVRVDGMIPTTALSTFSTLDEAVEAIRQNATTRFHEEGTAITKAIAILGSP